MPNENITVEELRQSLAQSPQQFFIIDLMSKEDYAGRHIPGAVNIPIGELESRASEIPRDKTVVAVCEHGLMKSTIGLQRLQQLGFPNAVKLTGGNEGWFIAKPIDNRIEFLYFARSAR